MTTTHHLAQFNVARLAAPLDDPALADFVAGLDPINALAEKSPGFVWRLQSDSGNATDILVYEDPMIIVNMSVWESPEALSDFVFRSEHRTYLNRRREFFERFPEVYTVLWWVPVGHVPSLDEAKERLALLEAKGPTPEAFSFREQFPPA